MRIKSQIGLHVFKSKLENWDCEYELPNYRTYQFAILQAYLFRDGTKEDQNLIGSSDVFYIDEYYTEETNLNFAEWNIYESERMLNFYPDDYCYIQIRDASHHLKLLIEHGLIDKIYDPICRINNSIFQLSLRFGGEELNSVGIDINLFRIYDLKYKNVANERFIKDLKSRKEDSYNKTIMKRPNFLNELRLFVEEKSLSLWELDEYKDFRTGEMTLEVYGHIMSNKSIYKEDEKLVPESIEWYRKIITKVAPHHAKRPGRAKR